MRKLLILLCLVSGFAWSFERPLPPNGIYGEMKSFAPGEIKIDDKTYGSGPGLRVFNTQNMIIQPGTVPQANSVWFQLEPNGYVWKLWLLSDEEAARIKQRLKDVVTTQ
ncbi:hypothetical protein [Andreprevotia chitinilytica]|uniref:hypothetical protein n=1 Tax=Andreprevotia chitinilytica TaxID=396808 RepID=UPI00054E0F28|nr:hypothetical protein [Andreprevotia chitinilytica]